MPFAYKAILLAAGSGVLLWLAVKVIIPLLLIHFCRWGGDVPVPVWFGKRHLGLTILAFNFGGPILFLMVLLAMIYLSPRA